jgi:fructosamine-3-kinase
MWQEAAVAAIGREGSPKWSALAPGSWTSAWSLRVGEERYFVKTAPIARAPMLESEADGLRALAECAGARIAVPRACASGVQGETAFLVLTFLDLGHAARGKELGRALAAMHRAKASSGPQGEPYGWTRDNFIGGTPQMNGWRSDWATFFCERRLLPQLRRALRAGHGGALQRDADPVLGAVRALLRGHDPKPAMLHGDLWSGNAGTLTDGRPAIFDPAAYVGDRETDIAMTRLFGGFDAGFYRGYETEWPLRAGHEVRRDAYNLYHVLNHLNLFGTSYLPQVERLMARILKGLGS